MQRMARALLVIVSALVVLPLTAKSAFAGPIDENFEISWSGAYGNGAMRVTGTELSSGVFQIFSINGVQNGQNITALLAPNTFYSNTNRLYFPTGLVDGGGLAFAVGATDYTFYFNPPTSQGGTYVSGVEIWECSGPPMSGTNTGACHAYGQGNQLTSFSVNQLPEPGSMETLSSGLLGMVGIFAIARRRRLMPQSI
jgi:hypothetical protein